MAAVLTGITWGHSRGITPLLAASQRYEELHPGVQIHWKKRTLQEFADAPIELLTKDYDLLIIDHPWVGCAAATKCVLPLEKYISKAYLDDQAANAVGNSHQSYEYNNSQWALAIDAATPAASYRADLFAAANENVPSNWEQLIALAKRGRVAVPAIPIDILMNFYSFCIGHGQKPFQTKEAIIDEATGILAINSMKQLYQSIDPLFFNCNPIAVAELMSKSDEYWYCPFAYCYSNYSRIGYARSLLTYTSPVVFNGKTIQTTIGGTGIAVSAFSKEQTIAVDFAKWIVSPEIQQSFYVEHGGQPGHRVAWLNENANRLTNNFFTTLLPVMDNGYIRPRYNGYLHFQDHAGLPLQQCLLNDTDPVTALAEMNSIYAETVADKKQPVL